MQREAEVISRDKAVAITVASSKGGVGKTTVASQLSCCLALTSHGRNRFQTCVVDFNTGFGDVCTMLDYDMRGTTLMEWIDDIRRRSSAGEKLETMEYLEEEIKDFLQKKEETGLYALIAPNHYTDSLDITYEELKVVMRNLQGNGGFDYVIYDTGNDLKDTTLLALEKADYVLLIATQDISCAHCLDAFTHTLESIRFDLNKLRLVINNVMSAKSTGISVAELQESFPYPCWAKIKHDPCIIRSGNFGKPIVFSTSHDMTKQLRSIIRKLNETEDTLQQVAPAKGFWKKYFSKGGK